MAVEIEIKLKVDHLSPVRDRLKALGAKLVGEAMETNVFFDTPDRLLLGSDCGLRFRRSRNLVTHGETLVLTYKGPRAEGPVKKREEIEVKVDSGPSVTDLLARLGYVHNLSFEKRRETWKLDNALIELDTLPHLGSYVEIEAASEADVMRLRDKLGLKHLASVTPSYPDLVSHFLSERGTHEHTLTFE